VVIQPVNVNMCKTKPTVAESSDVSTAQTARQLETQLISVRCEISGPHMGDKENYSTVVYVRLGDGGSVFLRNVANDLTASGHRVLRFNNVVCLFYLQISSNHRKL
jgi:hypothetical protein